MDCQNCGAPMILNRARQYWQCAYCKTFEFPNQDAEGVRRIGPAPDNLQCPVCHIPLWEIALDDKHHGYQCERCQGMLLTRGAFGETVRLRRAWATGAPEAAQPLETQELNRVLNCPHCKTPMDVHPYYGPSTIVIDTCNTCDALWLDYGELGRVINAPGKDRGAAVLGVAEAQERAQRQAQSISDFADYRQNPQRGKAPEGNSLLGLLRNWIT